MAMVVESYVIRMTDGRKVQSVCVCVPECVKGRGNFFVKFIKFHK